MNEASSSSVGIGNESLVRRGESTSNTTAWVTVGESALKVEVAESWGFDSVFNGDAGETGSVMIDQTCSLGPGVWVVYIE